MARTFTFRVKVKFKTTIKLQAENEDEAVAKAQVVIVEDIQKDGILEVADVDVEKVESVEARATEIPVEAI